MEDTDNHDHQPMLRCCSTRTTVQEEDARQNLMANMDVEEAGKLYNGMMADPSTVDEVYMSDEINRISAKLLAMNDSLTDKRTSSVWLQYMQLHATSTTSIRNAALLCCLWGQVVCQVSISISPDDART